jgi:hypothetical protein
MESIPSVLLSLLPPRSETWEGGIKSGRRGRSQERIRRPSALFDRKGIPRTSSSHRRRFPEHLTEFVVSVQTGMRLTEYYRCLWSQVHLDHRTIELTKTKNGSDRTVHLNADAVAALSAWVSRHRRPSDHVFPRQGATYDTRSLVQTLLERRKDHRLCLALQSSQFL